MGARAGGPFSAWTSRCRTTIGGDHSAAPAARCRPAFATHFSSRVGEQSQPGFRNEGGGRTRGDEVKNDGLGRRSEGSDIGARRKRGLAGGGLIVKAAARAAVEQLERRQLLSAAPLITEFLAINNNGLTDETG